MTSKFIEVGIGHTLLSFDGRLARKPFWIFGVAIPMALLYVIVWLSELASAVSVGGQGAIDGFLLATNLTVILLSATAYLWVAFATATKRLHDRNMSGWWVWLFLIPYFGLLGLVVVCALPGSPGENDFGPAPVSSIE
jgi:uncharacterized membrane protein YhaH (DUF805 family)